MIHSLMVHEDNMITNNIINTCICYVVYTQDIDLGEPLLIK